MCFFVEVNAIVQEKNFLSTSEKVFLSTLKLEKRRNEWLAGRYAAKKAIAEKVDLPMRDLQIDYDNFHRPVCSGLPLSITHSNGYAAAAIGKNFLGIDIEKVRKYSASLIQDFLTSHELSIASSDEAITCAWTRKEAVLKALGLGLTVPLKNIDVSTDEPKFFDKALERFDTLGKPKLNLETVKFGSYYFSIAEEVLCPK